MILRIQSWSRLDATSSLPRDTRTQSSRNTTQQVSDQSGCSAPQIYRAPAMCRLAEPRQVLPWQRVSFQCREDRTWEYSCIGFYSFLYFVSLWQCLSHAPLTAAARKGLKLWNRKYQRLVSISFTDRYQQEGSSYTLKLLSLNFGCLSLQTRVISPSMSGFTQFKVLYTWLQHLYKKKSAVWKLFLQEPRFPAALHRGKNG